MRMATMTTWQAAWRAFALGALLLGLVLVSTAKAQQMCGRTEAIVAAISDGFGEKPRAFGIIAADRIMQVYVGESGSWTIMVSRLDGVSCLIASGKDWEDIPSPIPGTDS